MKRKYKSMFGSSNPAKRPEVRKKLSEIRKKKIQQNSKDIKIFGRGNDASFKGKYNGMYGKSHTKKTKEVIAKKAFNRPKSQNERKAISERTKGEKNPNWRGGLTEQKYPHKFNENFKEEIRNNYGNICQMCFWMGKREFLNSVKLAVHHIDYDKKNLSENNLLPLCSSCHARVHKNRDEWKKLFQWYVNIRPTLSNPNLIGFMLNGIKK